MANIAQSIKDFGWKQPLVIDKKNVIVIGHGRLQAAKLLKLKSVPCVVTDLTEEECKRLRILDNKLNESDWDIDFLKSDIQDLNFDDYDEVIIYCDPPYRGTAQYSCQEFNHKEFDEWVKKLKYDVFISEYNCPFEKIASFGKTALLNNSMSTKKLLSENLYMHKAKKET